MLSSTHSGPARPFVTTSVFCLLPAARPLPLPHRPSQRQEPPLDDRLQRPQSTAAQAPPNRRKLNLRCVSRASQRVATSRAVPGARGSVCCVAANEVVPPGRVSLRRTLRLGPPCGARSAVLPWRLRCPFLWPAARSLRIEHRGATRPHLHPSHLRLRLRLRLHQTLTFREPLLLLRLLCRAPPRRRSPSGSPRSSSRAEPRARWKRCVSIPV